MQTRKQNGAHEITAAEAARRLQVGLVSADAVEERIRSREVRNG